MQSILKITSRCSTLVTPSHARASCLDSFYTLSSLQQYSTTTRKSNNNKINDHEDDEEKLAFKPKKVYTNEIGGIIPKSVAHSTIKNNWMKRQMTDNYVKKAYADKMISRAAYKLTNIDDAINLFKPGMVVVDLGSAPGGWTKAAMLRTQPRGIVVSCDLRSDMQVNMDNFVHGDFAQDHIRNRIRELIIKRKRELYFRLDSTSKSTDNSKGDNQESKEISNSTVKESFIDTQVPPQPPASRGVKEVDINAQYGKADVVVSDMAPPYCGTRAIDHARLMALAEFALEFAETVLKKGGSFVCKVSRGGEEKKFLKILESKFMSVKSMKPDASRPESTEIYYIGRNYLLDNNSIKK
ncbi:hypothetical protein CYY_002627 [Polysphondylium violaceum]|uniref:rRNA methyltransferase 2, mitochondrial n=1 Tax=Polysphondylium violaceum TaxID=133409 RepID=A0A8J4V244_9MYCE|nr:hypothetical protein CYY_002627 [Polysphondylium violaceum]